MNTLQYMRAFVCVAQTGSFTQAAELLGSTTANLSRAVLNLETHLRTRLLNRTTRRVAMTEAGKRYYQRCEAILASVSEADAEAQASQQHPAGELRVHAMVGIGMHYVIGAVAGYRENHPEVTFDLQLDNRIPDLIEEGYDLSIVLAADLPDSGYVSQRLGSIYSVLCAAPRYLQRRGAPLTPADLTQHDCLLMSMVHPHAKWLFDGPQGPIAAAVRHSPLQVNTIDGVRVGILSGLGIGVLPSYSAIDGLRSGALVRVLPEYRLQSLNLYALYPSRLYLDPKIRTWVDYLRESLPAALAQEEVDL